MTPPKSRPQSRFSPDSPSHLGMSCHSHLSAPTLRHPSSSQEATYFLMPADVIARNISQKGASTWFTTKRPPSPLGVGSPLRLVDKAGVTPATRGVIGGVRTLERRWVEFSVEDHGHTTAYLCVPIEWAHLGLFHRCRLLITSRWLLDSLPLQSPSDTDQTVTWHAAFRPESPPPRALTPSDQPPWHSDYVRPDSPGPLPLPPASPGQRGLCRTHHFGWGNPHPAGLSSDKSSTLGVWGDDSNPDTDDDITSVVHSFLGNTSHSAVQSFLGAESQEPSHSSPGLEGLANAHADIVSNLISFDVHFDG
ncbi:hypothetical protein B0H21DRAFT_827357 [Amylocystis lapponica]|nr:hypothetical protein B0H21DRAFT_827357 [Amylocystis lapponica]